MLEFTNQFNLRVDLTIENHSVFRYACQNPKIRPKHRDHITHLSSYVLFHFHNQKHSHLGSCAFPCDLDAERIVGNKDPVKPLRLDSLGNRWN